MSDPTPMTDLHLLPGDAHPGLLPGWCGQVSLSRNGDIWTDGIITSYGALAFTDALFFGEPPVVANGAQVRLDLHRPECIDRVIRVLAEGVPCATDVYRCTECGAVGDGDSQAFEFCAEDTITLFPEWDHAANECRQCDGTGYSIQPADVSRFRALPTWQAGPILAASVLRVVAGRGPVLPHRRDGLIPPWRGAPFAQFADSRGCDGAVSIGRMDRDVYTRKWRGPGASGPRTEDADADRRAADAAALAAGYALNNGNHILIPLNNGAIARVEAP